MNYRPIIALLSISVLSGCVSFDIENSLKQANEATPQFANGDLQLFLTKEQKASAKTRANELLQQALDQPSSIEVALLNSPAVQEMLAQHWAQSSGIALGASIPNPLFEFSRLSADSETEIERVFALGLLDLIRLPSLRKTADLNLQANQTALTAAVVDMATKVRQAWVAAVLKQQLATYATQIFSSAEASTSLAASMQAIGNFNTLARARQQAYYADAATNLTLARHDALAAREALVRLLGLDQKQASALTLPDRLPQLPDFPMAASDASATALENRLDVNMATAKLQTIAANQGIKLLGELTDIEITGASNTVWAEGERESIDGYSLEIELPLFKNINQIRNRMNAQTLAASSALEKVVRSANSHLRESYSAYRSSYDIARHYRDEVLPLQQLVSEENVLRYNGMIIGVFELLADSRTQIEKVQATMEASGQFWMADAALHASMVGKPTSMALAMTGGTDGDAEGH